MAARVTTKLALAACLLAQSPDFALCRHSHQQHHHKRSSLLQEGRRGDVEEAAEDGEELPGFAAPEPPQESLAQAEVAEGEEANVEEHDEGEASEVEAEAAEAARAEADAEADAEAEAQAETESEAVAAARQQRASETPIGTLKQPEADDEVTKRRGRARRTTKPQKTLALGTDGTVHHVDITDGTGMNGDWHHMDYERTSDFDKLSEVNGYRGRYVGLDRNGKIRHQIKDHRQTEWYPVTSELSDKLATEIPELQSALSKQHSSAQAAYDESVRYRQHLRDLVSELTHYQEGEHKLRDMVFAREDARSSAIKRDLTFEAPGTSEAQAFNEQGRDTQANHDSYMSMALDREDEKLDDSLEQEQHGASLLQTGDEAEDDERDTEDDRDERDV